MKVRLKFTYLRNKPGDVIDVAPGIARTLMSHRGATLVEEDDARDNKSMSAVSVKARRIERKAV